MTPRENPFRVDRVSALPFLGADVPALADRFERLGRAAIVGPHGAGKSTLLRSIGDELAARGRNIIRIGLPGSATRAERRAAMTAAAAADDAVVLFDGFEQCGWSERRRIGVMPHLLVTGHRTQSFRTLVTLRPTMETMRRVLEELVPVVSPQLRLFANDAFARHRGDIRATLFDLYDASGPFSRVLTGEG